MGRIGFDRIVETPETPTVPAPDSPAEREMAEELLQRYSGKWGKPKEKSHA